MNIYIYIYIYIYKYTYISIYTVWNGPGGPWKRTPFGASMPSFEKTSGYISGMNTDSFSCRMWWSV